MKRYALTYAQMRSATYDPKGPAPLGEKKTHIIEVSDDLSEGAALAEAERQAEEFLAERKRISLTAMHLPTKVLQPKPEFIPAYDAN